MKQKGTAIGLTLLGLGLYVAVVVYALFAMIHIDTLTNFGCAILFEAIGVILLFYFILSNLLGSSIKTGYFVPMLLITILYTVLLDIVNVVCVASISSVWFLFINLVLLLIYCVLTIPMYIMGRR